MNVQAIDPPHDTDAGRFPVLTALQNIVSAIPGWERGLAYAVAHKAAHQGTRRLALRGKWGPGLPSYTPYPTPGERLAAVGAGLWIETTSRIVDFRSAPPEGVRTGILLETTHDRGWAGLVSARFVVAHVGLLPIVLPGRCLLDCNAHSEGGLAYADYLREREGLTSAENATRAQLLQMYENERMLEGRILVRCLPDSRSVSLRGMVDIYQPIVEHGAEGLRAGLATAAVQIDSSVFNDNGGSGGQARRKMADYLLTRGVHISLSALRLAALNPTIH